MSNRRLAGFILAHRWRMRAGSAALALWTGGAALGCVLSYAYAGSLEATFLLGEVAVGLAWLSWVVVQGRRNFLQVLAHGWEGENGEMLTVLMRKLDGECEEGRNASSHEQERAFETLRANIGWILNAMKDDLAYEGAMRRSFGDKAIPVMAALLSRWDLVERTLTEEAMPSNDELLSLMDAWSRFPKAVSAVYPLHA